MNTAQTLHPSPAELAKLANMRGAGKAHAVIREKYDPWFGLTREGLDWVVSLECEATVSTTATMEITVKAPDPETAEELAIGRANNAASSEWEIDTDADHFEIEKPTIMVADVCAKGHGDT